MGILGHALGQVVFGWHDRHVTSELAREATKESSVTGPTASRVVRVADWKRAVRRVLYPAYEARVARRLPTERLPKHVGVMLDGNRRWAKAVGADTAQGHRAGAANIEPLLGWCEEIGVEVVTLWLLSTDNLNRPQAELEPLLGIIGEAVDTLAEQRRWRLHPVGALDLLPAKVAERLKEAAESTRDVDGLLVNIAVGYGGRREIADAVRSLLHEHAGKGTTLEELADVIDVEHIAEHLYTKGQPDPDLVIRTSGEQRLGGFLLWQSAQSEFYFCEAYWPDFRRVDFLRAVRAYAERERRYGA
jgi:short-chain Z-isoprenyl diphosphate synthase